MITDTHETRSGILHALNVDRGTRIGRMRERKLSEWVSMRSEGWTYEADIALLELKRRSMLEDS